MIISNCRGSSDGGGGTAGGRGPRATAKAVRRSFFGRCFASTAALAGACCAAGAAGTAVGAAGACCAAGAAGAAGAAAGATSTSTATGAAAGATGTSTSTSADGDDSTSTTADDDGDAGEADGGDPGGADGAAGGGGDGRPWQTGHSDHKLQLFPLSLVEAISGLLMHGSKGGLLLGSKAPLGLTQLRYLPRLLECQRGVLPSMDCPEEICLWRAP